MELIRLCRFVRGLCICAVFAALLTGSQRGLQYGISIYVLTLFVSQMTIEGFFVSACEKFEKEGRDGQKPDGEVGKRDVSQDGS